MKKSEKNKIISIFKAHPKVKLAYFFGSKSQGKGGPLSDYDIAVYLDERDKQKIFDLKFILQDKISRALKTDRVDVVMMDIIQGPEMKYNIINDGKLIYEIEPYKIIVEPKILNEYFDFRSILLKYGLTK